MASEAKILMGQEAKKMTQTTVEAGEAGEVLNRAHLVLEMEAEPLVAASHLLVRESQDLLDPHHRAPSVVQVLRRLHHLPDLLQHQLDQAPHQLQAENRLVCNPDNRKAQNAI